MDAKGVFMSTMKYSVLSSLFMIMIRSVFRRDRVRGARYIYSPSVCIRVAHCLVRIASWFAVTSVLDLK